MITTNELIAILGGWSIILTGIIYFIFNLIYKRLSLTWENKFKKELEFLKKEYDRYNTFLASTIKNYSSGFEIIQKEKIMAILFLWETIIEIKNFTSPQTFLYGYFAELEKKDLFDKAHLQKLFNNSSKNLDFNVLSGVLKKTDKVRPLIGENLWSLFLAYYGFVSYSLFFLEKSINEDNFSPWQEEGTLREIIGTAFKDQEKEFILSRRMDSFSDTIRSFENKIISNINKIFSGEEDVSSSITQINRIHSIFDKIENQKLNELNNK